LFEPSDKARCPTSPKTEPGVLVGSPKNHPAHPFSLISRFLVTKLLLGNQTCPKELCPILTPSGRSRVLLPELPETYDRSLSAPGILVSSQPNQIPMGRSRYHAIDTHPHFITCTVVNWLTLFSQPEITVVVLSSLNFLQPQKRLTFHAYVIMENHLHLIAIFWLNQLRFNKRPDKVQSTYQVWEEGFHPQMIQRAEVLNQKLEYFHNNPVRRGYVDEPWHWRYSSAKNY
jgi:putative transposase